MSKKSVPKVEGLELLDEIGEVEKALSEIAGSLGALAALLESDVEVDEEVTKGLAMILRGLSERSRQQVPRLRAVSRSVFGPHKGRSRAAK